MKLAKADRQRRQTPRRARGGQASRGMVESRLARLRGKMDAAQIDGLLVSQPHNRRYLSGYRAPDGPVGESSGWLVIGPKHRVLLTSFLNYEEAKTEAPIYEVVRFDSSMARSVAEAVLGWGLKRLGFEKTHMTYAAYLELEEALVGQCELVPCSRLVEELRAIKGPEEIAAIRRAAEVADRAFQRLLEQLRPGQTEKEVAWLIESWMREDGAEGMAFDLLVAAGPNSAVPHHEPTDRPIRPGEPVWVDIGAIVDGYCSDLTRTFCLGHLHDSRLDEIYRVVLQAQSEAIDGLRAGMTGREADALARSVIEEAGYGSAFGHSLGHGVGMAVHELPRFSPMSDDVTQVGMVATVEPGVYVAGWGGARIEDMVVLRRGKVEVLTASPKAPEKLLELG